MKIVCIKDVMQEPLESFYFTTLLRNVEIKAVRMTQNQNKTNNYCQYPRNMSILCNWTEEDYENALETLDNYCGSGLFPVLNGNKPP